MEVPECLRMIAGPVEERLRRLLGGEVERWSAVDADLAVPVSHLCGLVMAGGKRLRPAFCHWAYVGAGGSPLDPVVVDAGSAFELLHAFALVHDDVMDGSARRRGAATVHKAFEDVHHRAEWRGEARRYGEGVAILIGDLAFVYADHLVAGAGRTARDLFDELRIELNMGQYLDLIGTARGSTDLATARRIACYKSGKYTVERPLHVGAALAGRLDELVTPLSAYGLPLGEAFQLRDDVLGAFGDASATGKPVGDDLREGKPTPLLAIASERAEGVDAKRLEQVGDAELGSDAVADVQEVLIATGALAEVESRIDALTLEALAALADAPITSEAKEALTALAHFVAKRDR